MNLIIHQGAKEIGGTCIELRSGSTRIFLDCGLPLRDPRLEGQVNEGHPLQIPGLFAPGLPAQGIMLSHAHPDHAGLIHRTNPCVPVFATRTCFKMAMAGALFANQPPIERNRENVMRPGDPLKIGDFLVTAYPVDHSIAGACAFLIETDEKRLLYTGDLRFHGRKPGMRSALLKACRRAPLDLTITEGTALSRSDTEAFLTESGVEEDGFELVHRREGLVAAQFSPLNLDRMVTFLRIAKRTGRIFVIDPYAAYVVLLARSEGVRLPDPFCLSSGIRILIPPGFWRSRAGRAISSHRPLMEAVSVPVSDVLENPGLFLTLWRPSMRKAAFGGPLPEGTLCIRSFWKGYLESAEERVLADEFETGGIEPRHLHASGHTSRNDLVDFLKELDSRRILVVHSERPEALKEDFPNAEVAEDGIPFAI